jgi:hypothetical protein
MPTLNPEEPLNLVLDFGKYSPSADQRHAVISIVTELVEVLAGVSIRPPMVEWPLSRYEPFPVLLDNRLYLC